MNELERVSREVVIANRTYPLKIFKNDEERVLNIVQNVNNRVEQLRSLYDAKDNQDYLAMCLLQMTATATNSNTIQGESPNIEWENQIKSIENLLETVNSDSI
jgi:hypothetical protein